MRTTKLAVAVFEGANSSFPRIWQRKQSYTSQKYSGYIALKILRITEVAHSLNSPLEACSLLLFRGGAMRISGLSLLS